MMKLYTFHASGSAYRVRMALALKAIDYEPIYIVGGRNAKDLQDPAYRALNPSGVIPTLIDGDTVLSQTMAILEYLEETHPEPALLPADPAARARARAMAQIIVSDTHPLSAARTVDYLDATFDLPDDATNAWIHHWNQRGLDVIEKMLAEDTHRSEFCIGDKPTFADIALVSQVFAAGKFGVDLSGLPLVRSVYDTCVALPAIRAAAPENQADAPDT